MSQQRVQSNVNSSWWKKVRHGPVARLVATNFAIQGVGFAAAVIAARVLGVAGRGDLAAVLLWPLLAGNIGSLGVDWALAVQAGRNRHLEGSLTRQALIHGLLIGPLFMLITWGVVSFALPAGRSDLVRLAGEFILFIPFQVIWLDCLGIDNGLERFRRYNVAKLAFYVFYALGYATCGIMGADQIRYFVYSQLTAMILVVSVRALHSGRSVLVARTTSSDLRATIGLASKFAPATGANMLLVRIDVILVMLVLGTGELGLYVVAQSLAHVPSVLSQAFGVRTFGSSAAEGDESRFAETVTRRFRQSFVLSGAFAIVPALFAPWLVTLLFGPDFAAAAPVARVLFFASWLFNAGRIIDEGFRGQGRPLFGTAGSAVFIACVCVLGLVLGRRIEWGIMGVAWSVLAASTLFLLILIICFHRHTRRWVWSAGGLADAPGR